ncbi:hypothetical protein BCV69DRAFT_313140 [Microstroma glucosiphilum]|uniref:Uncharacterized protein n=1 Tax=Pseudomicrostroma glucosiphilum TaxID=1684307 RepID=A0A316U642_9BASI|nr:hypothetical protein BCV69DRAFT_313140 [Pseudomicrostroma glucosiphilum]PWN19931.1 hypothetical protein BCV69DRAFT_313140 [Pseudomicrostroma glucosiphilum]
MSSNGETEQKQEQQFNILPHPATTNDPNNDPALKSGNTGSSDPTGKPGVFVPQNADKLEQPKSSDELKTASAELNKYSVA